MAPVRRAGSALAGRADATVARGRAVAYAARADALAVLLTESTSALAWVRGDVLPTIIDDLVTDPKVREQPCDAQIGRASCRERVSECV